MSGMYYYAGQIRCMSSRGRAAARSCAYRRTPAYDIVNAWKIQSLYPETGLVITPISVSPNVDGSCQIPVWMAARVSGDGRDLVVLSHTHQVAFIRDFERICRGETSFEHAGLILSLRPQDRCCHLGFEHGRVCMATMEELYASVLIFRRKL
ncbi:hypothetical protein EDB87DRAFT_769636 [Lactarius vividus]|nr:hypothetical protein EDB87DRAFT_769636 [Lactarius vividus]